MPETELLAVTGNPVSHSLSPFIFNRLFRGMRMNAQYLCLDADNAKEAVTTAQDIPIKGLNVTSPFKDDMYQSLNSMNPHAAEIKAVNYVHKTKHTYRGYNTDLIEVVHTLQKNNIDLSAKRIVILGAGGAARSAVYGLIRFHAGPITLLNRTVSKAKYISRQMGCDYAPLSSAIEVLKKCDIPMSCIPPQHRILEPKFLNKELVVMDAHYKGSSLIEDAKEVGYMIINGRDWLLYQALPAFKIFMNKEVPKNMTTKIQMDLREKKPIQKSNIALPVFMGCGKIDIGRPLAKKMGYQFIDTYSLIQKKAGIPIHNIFKNKGESSFRSMEHAVIQDIITESSRGFVLSLGGGAVLNSQNVQTIRDYCHVVWLWTSRKTIQKRVKVKKGIRPLLPDTNSLESIEKILEERIPIYAKASDIIVTNKFRDIHTVKERIKHEMDQSKDVMTCA
jgi:shikimate dehydrogenase